MAIKQVFIPLTIKRDRATQMFLEAHDKKALAAQQEAANKAVSEAEAELDAFLEEDWKIIHTGQVETETTVSAHFVLFKSSWLDSDDNADDDRLPF